MGPERPPARRHSAEPRTDRDRGHAIGHGSPADWPDWHESTLDAALLQGLGLRRCHRTAPDPRGRFVFPAPQQTITNHPRRDQRGSAPPPHPSARSATPADDQERQPPELSVTNWSTAHRPVDQSVTSRRKAIPEHPATPDPRRRTHPPEEPHPSTRNRPPPADRYRPSNGAPPFGDHGWWGAGRQCSRSRNTPEPRGEPRVL